MFAKIVGFGIAAVAGALASAFYFKTNPLAIGIFAQTVQSDDCKQGGGKTKCIVKITVDPSVSGRCPDPDPAKGEYKVEPSPLVLAGKRGVTHVWRSDNNDDDKWRFCTSRGHGVWFDKSTAPTDDQFDEQRATNKDDGDFPTVAKDCHKFFRLRNANTTSTEYQYSIRFGTKSGLDCRIDPFIKNG